MIEKIKEIMITSRKKRISNETANDYDQDKDMMKEKKAHTLLRRKVMTSEQTIIDKEIERWSDTQ